MLCNGAMTHCSDCRRCRYHMDSLYGMGMLSLRELDQAVKRRDLHDDAILNMQVG